MHYAGHVPHILAYTQTAQPRWWLYLFSPPELNAAESNNAFRYLSDC